MKRGGPKLILLAALLGVYALLGCFPGIMKNFGVGVSIVWFRDTHSMLAASDSARAGLNPYADNPYDVAGEKHIYPDWWFVLGRIGLTRGDSFLVGGLLVGLFWLAVLLVSPLHSRREVGWTLLVCASPPFWLAVNRANPDLLVFAVLSLVVPLLLHRERGVRLLAPGPVALATGLKFFPILAGAALLAPAATRQENRQKWMIIVLLLLLLGWSLADDVQRYLAAGWVGRGLFTFGAAAIPLHYGGAADWALNLGRLAGIVLVGWAVVRSAGPGPLPLPASERERRFAFMGAAVLAGGFFLTVGYLYKIVFAVWLLPALLAVSASAGPRQTGARFSLLCLAGLLWVEGLTCAVFSYWPALLDVSGQAVIRQAAAVLAGALAWGFLSPIIICFGAELRCYGKQWFEIRDPAPARAAGNSHVHK